jgi:hypothetical protein
LKIASKFKDQSAFEQNYVVFDTVTPVGEFHVGLGTGGLERKQLFLTEVGQAAFSRLTETVGAGAQKLHLIEVTTGLKARSLVPNTFMAAKSGDSVFFVCKNESVYDTVFELLGAGPAPSEVPEFPAQR